MRYGANPNIGPGYVNDLINRDGVTGFTYATKNKFPIPQSERDADKALH
jgi:hypothetical protein